MKLDNLKEKFEIIKKKIRQKKPDYVPVMKVGTNRRRVMVLWGVLIFAIFFGVYKNFTAVDVHTIHEKEVIEYQLLDTNAVENFVKNFASIYYTWENDKASMENRLAAINQYLTKELQMLDAETIRSDIPTCSEVKDIFIWKVEQKKDNTYDVIFSVKQLIKEGNKEKQSEPFYVVTVYQDEDGNMVIIKNPTICSAVEKSDYEPLVVENDGTVNAIEQDEIREFLGTFFKLYPSASKKELAYYVKENALNPVERGDLVFAELVKMTCVKTDGQVNVSVTVKYLDQRTKAVELPQFDLILEKTDNWLIIGRE